MFIKRKLGPNFFEIIIKTNCNLFFVKKCKGELFLTFKRAKKIIMNLEKVETISAAGLNLFLSLFIIAKKYGIVMTVHSTNKQVSHMFFLTGLDELLTIQ